MKIKSNNSYDHLKSRGQTFEDAILVESDNTTEGVAFEYDWLENVWGNPGWNWHFSKQILTHKNEKHYDIIDIQLPNKKIKSIYFDITNFYGRHNFEVK